MQPESIGYAIVASALGRILVAATARGVCLVRFGEEDAALRETVGREFPFAVVVPDGRRVARWGEQLARYVDGRSSELDLPLDVAGSRFQRRVWDALRTIPRGETRSYSALAARLGTPRGARAVARACAANPVPIAIPCHRVVPKRGGPGGYTGGEARKRALLSLESREAVHRTAGDPVASDRAEEEIAAVGLRCRDLADLPAFRIVERFQDPAGFVDREDDARPS
jgi:AraC family transcriptional regulator of adaptative response/methylated-DNA-[protein]-cysteine methyltransferase